MQKLRNLTDEEVVSIVRSKDKEIYSVIIKRYEAKLLRYAIFLTGNEDEASDIVQNTFIKAYINLNGFNIKKKFSSWIYRIVHNEAINIIRKNKKNIVLDDSLELVSGIKIEDEIIKKELKTNTHKCLKQMETMYNEPLTLYYLEDKSYEEIGDILRIPMGTVATRINRAKAIMKKICKK